MLLYLVYSRKNEIKRDIQLADTAISTFYTKRQ
jgi:hypothetical protein